MKRLLLIIMLILGLVGVGTALWYGQNLKGIKPVVKPPPNDIVEIINTTEMPLTLPTGFRIDIFAKDLPGGRVMAFDALGNMWISQTSEGIISLLEIRDGKVTRQGAVLRNLSKPHGLAFDPKFPGTLFYAEEHRISRVPTYSDGQPGKIIDLPISGGGHFTRTLGFGPDDLLYVSIGSSCNACHEEDARRAKIFTLERDGKNFKELARGLRNVVFFTWHPDTQKMWATEMGRDLLGDDVPPDEINIVEEGRNYGWPICYGKNIHDAEFDKNVYVRNPCMEPHEAPSHIDIPAHSAPLGLAFVPLDVGWPEEYKGDLLVSYHGSWNRNTPTGYKIVRYDLDREGRVQGASDFISGWLTEKNEAFGRPVDLKFGPDRALYISDDKAGVVYRMTYPAVENK